MEAPPPSSSSPSSSPPTSAAPATASGRIFPLRATADAVKASAAASAAALASQVRRAGKTVAQAGPAPSAVLTSGPNVTRTLERFERRILEELARMFNDADAFYFSLTGDLTNCLQRQTEGMERKDGNGESPPTGEEDEGEEDELPLWRRADDRFFFNKHLLQELIDLDDSRADPFFLPLIQGFVELRKAQLKLFDEPQQQADEEAKKEKEEEAGEVVVKGRLPEFYTVVLISRRCRYRAGTSYS